MNLGPLYSGCPVCGDSAENIGWRRFRCCNPKREHTFQLKPCGNGCPGTIILSGTKWICSELRQCKNRR